MNKAEILLGPGLDLEYETDVQTSAPEPALYETAYVTSHKAQCRSGAFSPDGQLVATGSVDASIKVSGKIAIAFPNTYLWGTLCLDSRRGPNVGQIISRCR